MNGPQGKLDVPEAVSAIARKLQDRGYDTWAVGGAIRDALLGESRGDWDLATAAPPDAVRKLFRPSYPVGIQFGTVAVRGIDGQVYEVTTFRRDIETDGRHAVVEYAETLDEDLARRDFTINAIAYDPLEHKYHDPFSGWQDLQSKVLRCVGTPATRFAEDYLRVLRGLRFAGRFGLEIEPSTWKALTDAVGNLPRLSGERVREEIVKVMAAAAPSAGLALYRDSGALAVLLPELSRLGASGWEMLLATIDRLPGHRQHLRQVALLAPVGPAVEETMKRLRFSNAELRDVQALSGALEVPLPDADARAGRRWLREVGPERARDTLRLHFAGERASGERQAERIRLAAVARQLLGVLRRREPVTLADLAIDGNDLKELGLRPGPEFGRILDLCLDAVIDDPEMNEHERLIEYARNRIER